MKKKTEHVFDEILKPETFVTIARQYSESVNAAKGSPKSLEKATAKAAADAETSLMKVIDSATEKLNEMLKNHASDCLIQAFWSAITASDIEKKRLLEFGELVSSSPLGSEKFDGGLVEIKQLIGLMGSAGIGRLLETEITKETSAFYVVEVEEAGVKATHLWPGRGRFSEALRRVFNSQEFEKFQGEDGEINNRQILDDYGCISGEMINGGSFEAYSKSAYIDRFGTERYSEVVARKKA